MTSSASQSLPELLLGSSLGPLILQYLRWADIQRIACCCRRLKNMSNTKVDSAAIATAVSLQRELEILKCLNCPPHIMAKILDSMRQKHPYRVIAYDSSYDGLNEYCWDGGSNKAAVLETAFQTSMVDILFGEHMDVIDPPYPLAGIKEDLLQSILNNSECMEGEIEVEDAYINVLPKPTKKRKKVQNEEDEYCCASAMYSSSCRGATNNDNNMPRFFFVGGNTYCEYCLDDFFLIKLRFFIEHAKSDRRRNFSIEEDSYVTKKGGWKMTPELCTLKEDEFWVRLCFERNNTDFREIRFVGVGPRWNE